MNDRQIPCETERRELDDQYCFQERSRWALQFHAVLDCDQTDEQLNVRIVLCIGEAEIMMENLQYGIFAPISSFSRSYYCKEGLILRPVSGGFTVKKCSPGEKTKSEFAFLLELWKANGEGTRKAVPIRIAYHALKRMKRRPLWIISDRAISAGDNGEAFFRYLKANKPEIRTVFLLRRDSRDYPRVAEIGKVVPIRSMKHKLLYLLCDYNISSHADSANDRPLQGHDLAYRDIISEKKFVFLQHGITKDDVSGWLAKSRKNIFGFVTAAFEEQKSIINGSYGYAEQEVWLTGFPRFDTLPHTKVSRQIIISPTWRSYLMSGTDTATGERPLLQLFYESDYLKYYNKLLNDEELLAAAKKYKYQIAFFPHPTLQKYLDAFQHNQEVLFLGRETSYREIYASSDLIVTDYSSMVFDFAYLRKPVIYTQFDREEFFGGEHVYKKGYYDYERDGFGEVEYNLRDTVSRIIEYMENGCKMKDKYRRRVENFFAYQDRNNCRRVYEKLMEGENREADR